MASRTGSFGSSSTNPFGTGSLGNFSQYDIGGNLAELKLYEISVRWQNGDATDAEYLAALNDTLTYYSPGTRDYISAKDRLQDAEYRIGRNKVEDDLDKLIAFDQKWLAKLNPDSLRFRDLQQSLDAELAQRRSRDYGRLVSDYNDGKSSTESLQKWVSDTLAGLDPNAPDYEQWQQTAEELDRRVQSEKDSQVYQDYQQSRISGPEFLKYIQDRRDSMDPTSPDWADWNRRLEDAQKAVDDKAQQEADTAFFNAYAEGKKSDKEYLAYIQKRLDGMDASDPQYEDWRHRLRTATFSVTEDQLRFDVLHGRKPVSAIIAFYESYRKTMNPASAEWRQMTTAIESWRKYGGSGGGGGGGSSSSGTGKAGAGSAAPPGLVIGSQLSLSGALEVLKIDPGAAPKDQKQQKQFFDTNYQSLQNARQRGDSVWLFIDPRNPGLTTQARDPNGNPVVDAKGNPVMVRGAQYLPVTDAAMAQMDHNKADYYYSLSEQSLADHDYANFAKNYRYAIEAEDHARLVDSQAVATQNRKAYDLGMQGVDHFMQVGDWGAAYDILDDLAGRLAGELQNPMLDETRRNQLTALGEKLAENPLLPKIDPFTGNVIAQGALDANALLEGRFVLGPGWHHVLDKTDAQGRPTWGIQYDDLQDGSWEASHATVATTWGGSPVVGEARITQSSAGVGPLVLVIGDSMQKLGVAPPTAMIHFTDENGNPVRAYSLDGETWIKPEAGTVPFLELTNPDGSPIVLRPVVQNGTTYYYAETPQAGQQDPLITVGADGSVEVSDAAVGDIAWYGQRRYEAASKAVNTAVTNVSIQNRRLGAELTGSESQRRVDVTAARARVLTGKDTMAIGAPGQRMTMTRAIGSDGVINLIGPSGYRTQAYYGSSAEDVNLLARATATRARAAQEEAMARLHDTSAVMGYGFSTGTLPPTNTINPATGFTLPPTTKPPAVNPATGFTLKPVPVPEHIQIGQATGDIGYVPAPTPKPAPTPAPTPAQKGTSKGSYKPPAKPAPSTEHTGTGDTNRRSTGV